MNDSRTYRLFPRCGLGEIEIQWMVGWLDIKCNGVLLRWHKKDQGKSYFHWGRKQTSSSARGRANLWSLMATVAWVEVGEVQNQRGRGVLLPRSLNKAIPDRVRQVWSSMIVFYGRRRVVLGVSYRFLYRELQDISWNSKKNRMSILLAAYHCRSTEYESSKRTRERFDEKWERARRYGGAGPILTDGLP